VAQTDAYIESLLAPSKKPLKKKPTYIIKDVRLFLNTINRGLSLMKSAGVEASCRRDETEQDILLTIKIPK
jgi:ParB family chromosome partitioning protein